MKLSVDFSHYLREDEQSTWDALRTSALGSMIGDQLAEAGQIVMARGDEPLAAVDPRRFTALYRQAVERAADEPGTPWSQIIDEEMGDVIAQDDWARDAQQYQVARLRDAIWPKVPGLLEGVSTGISSRPSSTIEAFVEFMVDDALSRDDSLDKDEYRGDLRRLVGDSITADGFGPKEITVGERIIEKLDWRAWAASDAYRVELPIYITQYPGEYMDDKFTPAECVEHLDAYGLELLERTLPLLNLSGQALIDAADDGVFAPESLAPHAPEDALDRLRAIEAPRPDEPSAVNGFDFLVALGEASHGGLPVLYGFVPSAELLATDPRKPVRLEGDIQFGIFDPINGSGYLNEIRVQSITLENGLAAYRLGNQGYEIGDTFAMDPSAVRISMQHVELAPGVDPTAMADEPGNTPTQSAANLRQAS